ncbi:MAG: NAD(P)H-hydrate dehydratase [Sphingomonadaceae bacterium]|nr:NAD(P)H-hydrate dehydratase [Sphingomonadaceae bacterium]
MSAILTVAEMRAAEQAAVDAGTGLATLMDNAGAAVAEAAWRFGGGQPALVLCGPGNNGGDGYVAARLLAERGLAVRVAASGEPKTDLARAARARWAGSVEPLADAAPAPLLVDALFGVGLTRPLGDDIDGPLARLMRAARYRIAIDVPSGVGTDDGAALGCPAPFDLTIALGALKPAHLLEPAAALCGRVIVADIGMSAPESRLHRVARPRIAPPPPNSNKYSRGYALVVGGAMPGASMLTAEAAMRAGAGYVAIAGKGAGRRGPHALVRHVEGDGAGLARLLEDKHIGAAAVGPGLGRDAQARDLLDAALASPRPLVLDADALTLLGRQGPERLAARAQPMLITPHEGEFARLFGALAGSKVERARAGAKACAAVVLLKGSDTVIAAPDGRAAIGAGAPAWLASAGTGDVLAGLAVARLAVTGDPFQAAQEALWLHSEAGRRAGAALIADDLIDHLSAALAAVSR